MHCRVTALTSIRPELVMMHCSQIWIWHRLVRIGWERLDAKNRHGRFSCLFPFKTKKKSPKNVYSHFSPSAFPKMLGKNQKSDFSSAWQPSITHLSALKRIVAQNCWLPAPNLDGGKESQAMEIVSIDSNIRRKKTKRTTRFVVSWPPNLF